MQVTFDFSKPLVTIEGQELELIELLKLVREIAPKLTAINIIPKQVEQAPSPSDWQRKLTH